MLVEIKRDKDDPNSVPSKVYVDGQFECFGIEPSRTKPVHEGHPCIKAGTFVVRRSWSPHLHYMTPILLNVPDRSDIRWHIANFPKDILGCLGVGTVRKTDEVDNSRVAFDKIMTLLNVAFDAGEEVKAVYTDPA